MKSYRSRLTLVAMALVLCLGCAQKKPRRQPVPDPEIAAKLKPTTVSAFESPPPRLEVETLPPISSGQLRRVEEE